MRSFLSRGFCSLCGGESFSRRSAWFIGGDGASAGAAGRCVRRTSLSFRTVRLSR